MATTTACIMIMWLLISVCTLTTVTTHSLSSLDSDEAADMKIFEDTINDIIQTTLTKYDPIKMPFLPAISITMDSIDLALTMTEIEISSFSTFKVDAVTPGLIFSKKVDVNMTLPKLSFSAGQYAAAGQLLNMQLNGEGSMSLDVYDLKLLVRVQRTSMANLCIVPGSSHFWINLDHWEVNFEGMNTDSDQGQLVNTVLSTLGPEIFDYIENLLNGKYHKIVDGLLVKEINKAINSALNKDCVV